MNKENKSKDLLDAIAQFRKSIEISAYAMSNLAEEIRKATLMEKDFYPISKAVNIALSLSQETSNAIKIVDEMMRSR
jgi:enoyl-[acyl-carrier-protein] reductase (NADH)